MTTNNDAEVAQTQNDLTDHDGDQSGGIEASESAQLVLQKQQQAKELTESAAATTDPEERENLIRQALDCEVQARTHNFLPHVAGATLQVKLEGPETGDVIEIGPEALTGPLLDLASAAVLQDTVAELGAGLNAVGGWVYNLEGESEAKDGNGLAALPVAPLEAALPSIEEVLGAKIPTPAESEHEIAVNVNPRASIGAVASETSDLVPMPSNEETESVTLTEVSTHEDQSSEFEPAPSSSIAVVEVIETTVSTSQQPEQQKPRRKPRKLEIKAKKKPRKLEIRSDKKSP